MSRLAQRVAQREGPHIQQRVALTDGAEALQQQVVTHFPEYTLVLDIIHATEYLWDTANALLGETHPQRLAWVRAYLEPLLAGQTDAVITALEAEAKDPTCTATQRQAVRRTVGYYRRNRPYMHYDEYLARGWPIGTGVVEGACGHLVKDRMEQSGMRWTKAGAQAVLDLRAVRLNGHWDALLAVSSATATSAALWHLRAGAGVGGRPGAGVGGVINPLSTDFGHTQMILWRSAFRSVHHQMFGATDE